jgi:protein-S-isoprenylcysteine O-methyltransferase Ste14
MLVLRALISFLVLPGVVAFLIPLYWIRPRAASFFWPAGVPLVIGAVILLWCVWDFYRTGKGTLAPWDPPRNLVRVGLYRWTRNPMYVGVGLINLGWALGFGGSGLWWYWVLVMVGFHLRVVLAEEPYLARTHGAAWVEYKERVPRWFLG